MKLKRYLPVIGITIFAYILFRLDFRKILEEISNANLWFIFLALCFTFVFLITQTLKWFVIAKAQKTHVPFPTAFRINLISFFYGFITPSSVGGAIRAEYLKKYNNNNVGKGIGNFAIDKVFDLFALIFLGGAFSFMFGKIFPINYIFYLIGIFAFLVIILLVFRDRERSKKILRIFYRKLIPNKIKSKMKKGFYSFYENMPKKRNFILFFFFNVINWTTLYTMFFFVGLSLGINIPYLYFLAIMPIATLIGHLPLTINGLGTREAIMIWLFGFIGVESTKVFSMSVVSILIAGIIPAIIGYLLIFKTK